MKLRNLLFILFGFILICKITSAQITFRKSFSGAGYDIGNYAIQTFDSGYLVVGETGSFGYSVYLIKTDQEGDTLWTKTFEGIRNNVGLSIQQTSDSGFIFVGTSYFFGSSNTHISLIKTNAFGVTMWTKTFGGFNYESAASVQQTNDNGYIVAGTSASFGSRQIYLVKANSNGDTLWTRTIGLLTGRDNATSVKQTNDGGYILLGNTSSSFSSSWDIYLIKTDSYGDTLWTKTFGEINEDDWGNSVQQTIEGGYIIAGGKGGLISPSVDVLIIKTDTIGNILWAKTYGGEEEDMANSIQQTKDSGYIITGYRQLSGSSVYLIKTDVNGDTLWTKNIISNGGVGFGNSVNQTYDNGFIITGSIYINAGANPNVYLIKTDESGNSCPYDNVNILTTIKTPVINVSNPHTIVSSGGTLFFVTTAIIGNGGSVINLCDTTHIWLYLTDTTFFISPNPFTNELSINGTKENGVAIIFDITGKKILHQKTFNGETKINTAHLSNGFYFLNYFNEMENERVNVKLVKSN